jgi:hypothetical protein
MEKNLDQENEILEVIKYVKYGVEFFEFQNEKWGKIGLKISNIGNLQLVLTPSLTPGIIPQKDPKTKKNIKGIKVYDYSKEVLSTLEFNDCLNIIKMGEELNPNSEPIVLYRNSEKFLKTININWYVPDGENISTSTFFVKFKNLSKKNEEINFKIPVSIETFLKIKTSIQSYINCLPMIKLFTNAILNISNR